MDWEENDETRWWVRLRCGACGETHETVITDDQAKHLERDLAPGLRKIAETVEKLDRERMLWEVDVFVAALERDLDRCRRFRRQAAAAMTRARRADRALRV